MVRFFRKVIDVPPKLYNKVTGISNIDGIIKRIQPFDNDLHIKFIKKSIQLRIINGNSNMDNK